MTNTATHLHLAQSLLDIAHGMNEASNQATLRAAAELIERLRTAEPPSGWVLMPENPDEPMLRAMGAVKCIADDTLLCAYLAAVAARPECEPVKYGISALTSRTAKRRRLT